MQGLYWTHWFVRKKGRFGRRLHGQIGLPDPSHSCNMLVLNNLVFFWLWDWEKYGV